MKISCSFSIERGHLLHETICQVLAGMPLIEHTVFSLTHTLLRSNSYILYTRTLMPVPTQKLYTSVYIHIHTHASTQYLSRPSSASQTHYQPPSTQLLSMSLEVLPVSLSLAVILPLFIYLSLFLSLYLSFLFSGFLLPVDPVLFLDSNTL